MDLQKQLNNQLSESKTSKNVKTAKSAVLNLRQEIDEINRSLTGKIKEFNQPEFVNK